MWLALDQPGIVPSYSDLAEAMPDVPLVLYDNPMTFKGKSALTRMWHWPSCPRLSPRRLMRACWSGHVVCAPNMHVALSRAISAWNWPEAERLSEKCSWAESAMFVGGDIAKFMDYSIPVGHQRFAAAGLIDPGPPRPPYTEAPDVYLAAGRSPHLRP